MTYSPTLMSRGDSDSVLTHSDVQRPVVLLGGVPQVADRVGQVRGEGAVDVGLQLQQVVVSVNDTFMFPQQHSLPIT